MWLVRQVTEAREIAIGRASLDLGSGREKESKRRSWAPVIIIVLIITACAPKFSLMVYRTLPLLLTAQP
jgi:hypothetical protein